jgi:hypothetical protein
MTSFQLASSLRRAQRQPRGLRRGGGFGLGLLGALADGVGTAQAAASSRKAMRHARDQAHAADDGGGDVQHLRLGEQLADQLPPMSWSLATRDTTTPAAVEMISEGICATRPSPMASSV